MTVWSLILSPRLISVHYQVSSFTVKVSFSLCVLLSLASLVSLFQICSRCVSHLFPLCPALPCVSSLPERTVQFTSIILSHGLCTDVSLCPVSVYWFKLGFCFVSCWFFISSITGLPFVSLHLPLRLYLASSSNTYWHLAHSSLHKCFNSGTLESFWAWMCDGPGFLTLSLSFSTFRFCSLLNIFRN